MKRGATTRAILALLATALLLAACGSQDRPSISEWQPRWEAAQETVPAPEELERPPPQATCQRILGELRSVRPDITPAPDELVETEVDAWFTYAEHVFFSCFDQDSVDEAYQELERLTEEVDTALRTAGTAER